MRGLYDNKIYMVLGFGFVLAFFSVMGIYYASKSNAANSIQVSIFSMKPQSATNRKILALPADYDDEGSGTMNRIGAPCSKESIYIFQGPTSPLPNGIPTYTVQIQNVCVSGSCSISNIHLSCGWFSSARLINPNIFRRISYDDCLVNNGEPLNPGESLSFQYANTFQYPMSVSSVACY